MRDNDLYNFADASSKTFLESFTSSSFGILNYRDVISIVTRSESFGNLSFIVEFVING